VAREPCLDRCDLAIGQKRLFEKRPADEIRDIRNANSVNAIRSCASSACRTTSGLESQWLVHDLVDGGLAPKPLRLAAVVRKNVARWPAEPRRGGKAS
jgi:hypothetical protein